MSAFIVSKKTIDAILTYAGDRNMSYYNPDTQTRINIRSEKNAVGQILYAENYISVNYCYEEKTKITKYQYIRASGIKGIQILKLLHCLEYQSCEHPEYYNGLAHHINKAIERQTISSLPGYDDADWGF